MTPEQRIENFDNVIAAIKSAEDQEAQYRFHMEGFISEVDEVATGGEVWIEEDFCGTCCCIGGTIRVIQLGLKEAKKEFDDKKNIREYVMKAGFYLGMEDYDNIRALFCPWNNAGADFPSSVGNRLSPSMAIQVLERLRDNPHANAGDVVNYWNEAWAKWKA